MKNRQNDDKNLKLTFAAIEKMHYSDFNSGNHVDDFRPADILDEDDSNISDDEVLSKFKNQYVKN